jgi:hypothetical protein
MTACTVYWSVHVLVLYESCALRSGPEGEDCVYSVLICALRDEAPDGPEGEEDAVEGHRGRVVEHLALLPSRPSLTPPHSLTPIL